MSSLLSKLKKNTTLKHVDTMASSQFFNGVKPIKTEVPILNLALSGSLHGGVMPGLITVAAPSKHFKSGLSLYMVSAYLKAFSDAVCLFYDAEFGSPPAYLNSYGIDLDRVLHTPITNIEDLRTDITNQLEGLDRNDKVIIFIDSIGNLASKKETKDAIDGSEKADFTRAKVLKSMFRIITPQLLLKNIPCIVINHVYNSMELFSKQIMSGGTGALYSSNVILYISKSQEKDGADLSGFKFTLTTEKSRGVREKSKFPLHVAFGSGINKYSGLLDLALELDFCRKPKQGWYNRVLNGTQETKNWRAKDTDCDEFWDPILNNPEFEAACNKRYMLTKDDISDSNLEDLDDDIDYDSIEIDE
jgi:RecA/RadA recombinase